MFWLPHRPVIKTLFEPPAPAVLTIIWGSGLPGLADRGKGATDWPACMRMSCLRVQVVWEELVTMDIK